MRACVRDTVVGMLCFLLLVPPLSAQYGRGGARTVALAGAAVALGNVSSSTANPASTGTASKALVSLTVGSRFGVQSLREIRIDSCFPLGRRRLNLEIERFGTGGFAYYRGRLGLGFQTRSADSRGMYWGLAVDRFVFSIPNYDRYAALGISAGIQIVFQGGFRLGGAAHNLNRPRFAHDSFLPSSLCAGAAIPAGHNNLVLLAVTKPLHSPAAIQVGFECDVGSGLVVRLGMSSPPRQIAAGIGIRLNGIASDVAFDRHHHLGWSPTLSVLMAP